MSSPLRKVFKFYLFQKFVPEKKTDYEARKLEYACYNEELDLWNNAQLSRLERDLESKILMEKLDAKNKFS